MEIYRERRYDWGHKQNKERRVKLSDLLAKEGCFLKAKDKEIGRNKRSCPSQGMIMES